MPKRLDLDEDRIRELYVNEGKTGVEIGKVLGVSCHTIINRLKKLGIRIRESFEYKKIDLDEDKIRELYLEKGFSAYKISKIMNVSPPSIKRKLKKMNIRIRPRKYYGWGLNKIPLDLEKIKRLYLYENKTCEEIAKIFGVHLTTILRGLNKLKIVKRKGELTKIKLDLNKVKDLYVNQKKSALEISKILGADSWIIYSRLKELGIERRNASESLKGYKQTDKHIMAVINGLMKRPSSYEKKISELCIEKGLPFIYTGNGTFLIGHKNPDFVNKEKRIAIEVYHNYFKIREFGSCEEYEKQRSEYFAKYGYNTIFIRTEEIEDKNWKELCSNKIQDRLK